MAPSADVPRAAKLAQVQSFVAQWAVWHHLVFYCPKIHTCSHRQRVTHRSGCREEGGNHTAVFHLAEYFSFVWHCLIFIWITVSQLRLIKKQKYRSVSKHCLSYLSSQLLKTKTMSLGGKNKLKNPQPLSLFTQVPHDQQCNTAIAPCSQTTSAKVLVCRSSRPAGFARISLGERESKRNLFNWRLRV